VKSRRLSTYHNIHVHTEYSILDGVGFCEEYAKLARAAKMGYVCITDHGMAAAWPSLIDSCDKHGLKPVFGVEVYVNDFHHLVPKFKELDDEMKVKVRKSDHMLLIAINEKGFENLIKLVSLAWEKGFYYKPRLTTQQIWEHSDGIIATSGCFSSPINQRLAREDAPGARQLVKEWADVFKDRFYIEWMMIHWAKQEENNRLLFDIVDDFGLPPVVTNDVHYAQREDAFVQKVQLLIQSKNGTLKYPKGLVFDSDMLWFTTEDQMDERWDHYRKMYGEHRDDLYAVSKRATLDICQRCGYIKIDRSQKLPEIEGGEKLLAVMCWEMMDDLGWRQNKVYCDRLEEELELIEQKGFSSYFLTQKDICDAVCDELGSPRSPGRGSVGGSLVAFLLKITQLDPIKHKTLFSRFLSPSRGGRQMILKP